MESCALRPRLVAEPALGGSAAGQDAEGQPKRAAEPKEQLLVVFPNLTMKKPLFKQDAGASVRCASPKAPLGAGMLC